MTTTENLRNKIEEMIQASQYDEACALVAKKMGLTFSTEFVENNYYFEGDKDKRDIYNITLSKGGRNYTFKFGQSLNKSGFYAQQGRMKIDIDRKYIDKKDLFIKSKHYMLGFGRFAGNDKIVRPEPPTLYDILTCLTKYDIGTFEDFCGEFGYNEDSIMAKKTYKAVEIEYLNVQRLFNSEEIEILSEIS